MRFFMLGWDPALGIVIILVYLSIICLHTSFKTSLLIMSKVIWRWQNFLTKSIHKFILLATSLSSMFSSTILTLIVRLFVCLSLKAIILVLSNYLNYLLLKWLEEWLLLAPRISIFPVFEQKLPNLALREFGDLFNIISPPLPKPTLKSFPY